MTKLARIRPAVDNAQAVDAFLAAKAEIDAMLKRLTDFSADHFGARIDTRDHLQAWEVAVAALVDLVRESEALEAAA